MFFSITLSILNLKFSKMKLCTILMLLTVVSFGACKDDPELQKPTPEGDNPGETSGVVEYEGNWYQPGDTIYGYKDYVYLVVGDAASPLLLGVPHDGIAEGSPAIPESGTTGRDIFTHPLADAVAELFEDDTQLKPWIMVNTISRKRLDPNTYPDDAPGRYTNADAMSTYESYHELMHLARTTMSDAQENGNGGLFLDLHGHAHKYANGHEEPYVSITTGNTVYDDFIHQSDLGYGISNYSLEQSDAYLDGIADSSTISYLAKAHPEVSFSELIRGPESFGGLLQAENLVAVPSDVMPVLDRDQLLFGGTAASPKRRPYFNGGYCTRAYGTLLLGSTPGFDDNIVAIQMETPGINVRNNSGIRERSSHQIKRAIINYLNIWFGYNFNNSPYPY